MATMSDAKRAALAEYERLMQEKSRLLVEQNKARAERTKYDDECKRILAALDNLKERLGFAWRSYEGAR